MNVGSGFKLGQKKYETNTRNKRISLLTSLTPTNNPTLDEESRAEFVGLLNSSSGLTTSGQAQRNKNVQGEIAKALEGTDPKYKARLNMQKLYEIMTDRPGQKQTRGVDLLMSNSQKGIL